METSGQTPLLSSGTRPKQSSNRDEPIDSYWRSRSRPRLPVPRSQPSLNLQLFVCFVVSSSWVFTTEVSAKAQAEGFDAYVLLYMSTSSLSLFFLDVKVRMAEIEPQRGGLLAKRFAAPFLLMLWLITNLSFLWALTHVRISTVTAIFSTNTVFVFILSYLVLKEKSNEWKLLSVACAVIGVCLATIGAENSSSDDAGHSDDHSSTDAFIGCLLSILAALLAALYKVIFYYLFGEASTVEVMKFLAHIGVLNFCCGLVVVPILYFLEYLHTPGLSGHSGAWILAMVSVLCSVFFNLAVNLGVAFTSPLVVSIGMVLGVPLAVVVDCAMVGLNNAEHDGLLSVMSILGYVGCILAVVFMLVPSLMKLQTGRFASLSTVSVHGGVVDDASIPVVERSISDVFQRTLTNTLIQQGRGAPAPSGASYISSFGDEDERISQTWMATAIDQEVDGETPPINITRKKRIGLYGYHFKEMTENISNLGMMLESMCENTVIVRHVIDEIKQTETSVFGLNVNMIPMNEVDILVLNNGMESLKIETKTKAFLTSDFISQNESSLVVFSCPVGPLLLDDASLGVLENEIGEKVNVSSLENRILNANKEYVEIINGNINKFKDDGEDDVDQSDVEVGNRHPAMLCPVSAAFSSCRSTNYDLWLSLFIKQSSLNDNKTKKDRKNSKKDSITAQLSVLGCYFVACVVFQSIFNHSPPHSIAVPLNPSTSFLAVGTRQSDDIIPSHADLETLYNLAQQQQ